MRKSHKTAFPQIALQNGSAWAAELLCDCCSHADKPAFIASTAW